MLILIPPSEGKAAPEHGTRLRPTELSFPELNPNRTMVISALTRLCRDHPLEAVGILGLGPKQRLDILRNADLPKMPAAPAIEVYNGVLFEALGAPTLSSRERARLNRMVVIASGLFGLLRPDDRIPAYRLSGGATLPSIGPLTGVWRESVSMTLAGISGVILDLRSSEYVNLGPIPASAAPRSLSCRVLLEKGGKRSVVSHHNKSTKGRLVRSLITSGANPRSVNACVAALTDLGFRCELRESLRPDRPTTLDVIVREHELILAQ